ncbi:MAG: hypothetical protein KF883_00375 [Thermomicrobiales bacterium]|nr:hypothetical protein [Thermomicrobiales bacterium]
MRLFVRVPRAVLAVVMVLSAISFSLGSWTHNALAQGPFATYTYHQITNLTEGSGYLGFPVLSADGTTGVFSDAPGTGDPETPNRIYTIGFDGSGMTEVDSYTSLCYCDSFVDISDDGSTAISSESVQVRIADGGGARALITLASNEITAISVSGDGETVFFLVRRSTAMAESGEPVPMGIWAIDASGENLRQIVSPEAVAAAVGAPVDPNLCCFHRDGYTIDSSSDGSRIVFAALAGGGENVLTANGSGGDLTVLREELQLVFRVAISGDGSTVAYDVVPLESDVDEVEVVAASGGAPRVMPGTPSGGYYEPIQLSDDGSLLLVSPFGLLYDIATGDVTTLAVSIPNVGGTHQAVLTDGLARATMDATGRTFLYAMRTVRCADCANLQEQLATMEIDAASPGQSPAISAVSIEPAEIGLNGASSTTAQAAVSSDDEVLGVGFAALLGGFVDMNVGSGATLLDDGSNGDQRAGDGTFTASGIVHAPYVTREEDTGERVVRIAAESETDDGLRHATAIDAATLTVVE